MNRALEIAGLIRQAEDALSRARDGLDPHMWNLGEVAYPQRQLWIALGKIAEAHAVCQQRAHAAANEREGLPIFDRIAQTRPRGA